MPPAPTLSVDPSVPENVSVLFTVSVLLVVPPATVNPVVAAVNDKPLYVLPDKVLGISVSANATQAGAADTVPVPV